MTSATTPTTSKADPEAGSVWRGQAFRLFFAAETISAAGTGIGAVALPVVAVAVLGAGPLAVGLLEAAVWAPWLAFGLLAGVLVDRAPQRPLMIVCDVAAAGAYLTVPVAAVTGVLGIGQLVVVALVAGSVNVLSEATRQTYPPLIVTDDHLPTANSSLQAAQSAAEVTAAPASGLLTHLFGAVAGITANALSFVVSAVLLLLVRTPDTLHDQGPAPRSTGIRDDVIAGLRIVINDPWLRTSATAAGLANFVLTGVGTLQALLLIRTVGVPAGWFGPLLLGEAVGGLAGAALAIRLGARIGTCRAVVLLAVTGPIAGLLIAATGPGVALTFFVAGSTASTAAIVGTNVLQAVFRQRYVPRDVLGRVTASTRVIAYSAAPLGALTAGTLAAAFGTRLAVASLLTVGVGRGLLFLGAPWRTARELPTDRLAS